jgi:hypothetical protein
MLLGSPAGAGAFGITASPLEAAAPEPSQATRPLAQRGPGLLQWHRCAAHCAQPCGWWEGVVRGHAPARGAARLRAARGRESLVLFPVAALAHGTPTHDAVGTVRRRAFRTAVLYPHGDWASHPPAQARGLAGLGSVTRGGPLKEWAAAARRRLACVVRARVDVVYFAGLYTCETRRACRV